MSIAICAAIALAIATAHAAPARAQDDAAKTRDEASELAAAEDRLAELEEEFDDARSAYWERYEEADEKERQVLMEEGRPDPAQWVPRFRALADEFPGTEVAAGAPIWIASNSQDPEQSGPALDTLIADHIESPHMKTVCGMLTYRLGDGEALLQKIYDSSPDHEVKGTACYTMARNLMQQVSAARTLKDADADLKAVYESWMGADATARLSQTDPKVLAGKAEKLFELVVGVYADVPTRGATLGKAAECNLFELRHLQIGMVAPDIEGEDIDGVAFKLSDYRGKVVVLDFWGDW